MKKFEPKKYLEDAHIKVEIGRMPFFWPSKYREPELFEKRLVGALKDAQSLLEKLDTGYSLDMRIEKEYSYTCPYCGYDYVPGNSPECCWEAKATWYNREVFIREFAGSSPSEEDVAEAIRIYDEVNA